MRSDRSLPRGDPHDLDDDEHSFVREIEAKVTPSAGAKVSSYLRKVLSDPLLSKHEAARVRDIAEAMRFPLGDFDSW